MLNAHSAIQVGGEETLNTLKGWLVIALVASLVLIMGPVGGAFASRVEHRVTVGGPDLCEDLGLKPGCDANFSLVALLMADGSVKGQYHDQFSHLAFPGLGGSGFHAAIDCLNVIGSQAWVSGVITQSRIPGLVGSDVVTTVVDNGRSANDPADQISFSFISFFLGDLPDCNDAPIDLAGAPLFSVPQVQVVVQ